MDSSFTDYEKRFVLAEMIKASPMDWKILRDFLRAHEVEPDLLAMQLPPGRNMHQCIRAAETMGMHLRVPELPQVLSVPKRKSASDLKEPIPKRQAIASPLELAPAPTSASAAYGPSRSFGGPPRGSAPLPLPLPQQPAAFPMPAAPSQGSQNGYSPIAVRSPQPVPPPSGPISTPTLLPTRRKRGRPSKADMEARARERVISRATGYQPIKAAPVPIAPSLGYQIASIQPPDRKAANPGSASAGDGLGKPDAIPRIMQATPTLMPKAEPSSRNQALGPGMKPSEGPSPAQGLAEAPTSAPSRSQLSPNAPPADMGLSTREPEQKSKPASAPAGTGEQEGEEARNESPVSVAS